MSSKHYNISYLENTGLFLKNLKEHTYQPFLTIADGTIIDLGCGTGMDVINMAQLLGDKVKMIGIDHDAAMLDKGRLSNPGLGAVEFIQSEADVIPFEDNSISGLRAERLIQHLKKPEAVINEVKRVLKPDQPFVIVETDWAGLIFYDEHTNVQKKLIQYLTEVKINNGMAARKLTSYLEKSGFRNIKIEIFPFVLNTLKEANDYLWIELILQEATQKGHLNDEEYESFINSLRQADDKKYFSCSINIVVVSSIK